MDEEADDTEEGSERTSRSERKRRAEAAQRLGVRLITLRLAQLHSLQLPPELLDAVLEAQRLRSRSAIARQRQFIGRLMRALDPEPIERALTEVLNGRNAKMPR